MWAADFDEAATHELEESCLEPLVLHLPEDSSSGRPEESIENDRRNSKGTPSEDGGNEDYSPTDNHGMGSVSSYPFCGLGMASFWARHPHERMEVCTIISSRNGDLLPVFCAAAILINNRQKIIKETHAIDDLIKVGLFYKLYCNTAMKWLCNNGFLFQSISLFETNHFCCMI